MKVSQKSLKSNKTVYRGNRCYDYYFALDWSIERIALAHMRSSSSRPKVIEMNSDLSKIKEYVSHYAGRRILCIEETTGTHWLYVELKDYFDKILVCDPYRNHLLSEGAKTDKIDAEKLCQLLRGNLLKEVYHSMDADYHLRKLISGYEDWIKFGVRFKNQRSALYRSMGLSKRGKKLDNLAEYLVFVEEQQNQAISFYEDGKKKYIEMFKKIKRRNSHIQNLMSISGIDLIFAITIYGIVIDPSRFENKYKYWAYCGLVSHPKDSGGRSYGKRKPRHSHKLKHVYKSAALAAIGGKNDIREYYETLLGQGLSPQAARNAVARYIAKSTYGMLKHNTKYQPYSWR